MAPSVLGRRPAAAGAEPASRRDRSIAASRRDRSIAGAEPASRRDRSIAASRRDRSTNRLAQAHDDSHVKERARQERTARVITVPQFLSALEELSRKRFPSREPEHALRGVHGLVAGGTPAIAGVTKATSAGAVSRLTDASRFTGSHRERFDEAGRGRGRAGREEEVDASGYVASYKGAGSYHDKVKGGK
ncbi:tubulin polymerization-promoting protein family member 2-like isoform X2 [Petromyzon marinus]|uniref:tubulin polymerization-promoting protein family member 2-like isoform X2 n=1 Tax=Petromyzon marinus TaxID=7757 RepID=UPI003F727165